MQGNVRLRRIAFGLGIAGAIIVLIGGILGGAALAAATALGFAPSTFADMAGLTATQRAILERFDPATMYYIAAALIAWGAIAGSVALAAVLRLRDAARDPLVPGIVVLVLGGIGMLGMGPAGVGGLLLVGSGVLAIVNASHPASGSAASVP